MPSVKMRVMPMKRTGMVGRALLGLWGRGVWMWWGGKGWMLGSRKGGSLLIPRYVYTFLHVSIVVHFWSGNA